MSFKYIQPTEELYEEFRQEYDHQTARELALLAYRLRNNE